MFTDSCCGTKDNNESITEALASLAEAYTDSSNVELDTQARHNAQLIQKEYNKRKQVISDYVTTHPEYKYMLSEQSLQKLAEFYEDIKTRVSSSISKSRKKTPNIPLIMTRKHNAKKHKSMENIIATPPMLIKDGVY
jgi:hypothetical protein